jgi:hypothetical protein
LGVAGDAGVLESILHGGNPPFRLGLAVFHSPENPPQFLKDAGAPARHVERRRFGEP